MKRLPIRVRLTAAFAAVMAIVLGATGLFLYLRFSQTLDDTVNTSMRDRSADVRALVSESNASTEIGGDALAQRHEQLAQILDSKGHVIESAPELRNGPVLTSAQVRRALKRSVWVKRTRLPAVEGTVRLLAAPVTADGQRLVAVVGSKLDDRDESLSELVALLLIGGPIALVLASGAGYAVTSAALRPVEAMRRRAGEISAGEPGQRLPVPAARDEVGRLGETLNAMLARLEVAFARERTFVSDASHELRTPLAILKTELELALRHGRSADELEQALRSAAEETDRLAQLAEDLLVIARSDQGRLPIRREPVALADIFETVRQRYSGRAEAARVELVVDGAEGATIVADELRLEQALGNLVDNALRYGAGPVVLGAHEEAAAITVFVRDSGPGFPDDFIGNAFERFTRADVARSRGGAGLGLAIVAAIATAHGGSVRAAPAPGGGAEVSLTIPAAGRVPEAAPT